MVYYFLCHHLDFSAYFRQTGENTSLSYLSGLYIDCSSNTTQNLYTRVFVLKARPHLLFNNIPLLINKFKI